MVKKILIVDDEPLSLKVLEQYLGAAGYDTECAVNGVEAWRMLKTRSGAFSALVLDWMMPEMDGVTLLKKMQTEPLLAAIPAIMLTGVEEQDDILEAVQAGAFDYLVKPVEKDLLLAMIERASAHEVSQENH